MTVDANTLDILVKIAQLIGIPVGIVVYGLNKRRERLDREYGTYNALDEKYVEYLKLCLDQHDLDVSDVPKEGMAPLTPEQRHRELILFSILMSIMERAYLMYQDKSDDVRHSQWEGWSAYITDWSRRPNFALAAPALSQQFDQRFYEYLRGVIRTPPAGRKPIRVRRMAQRGCRWQGPISPRRHRRSRGARRAIPAAKRARMLRHPLASAVDRRYARDGRA
jgi:hypothetical protein